MIVFLRLLVDESGHRLFTHQELASIVESSNRQASSNRFESFVACGCDFNDEVVSAVLEELMQEPLAKVSELNRRVNSRLNRNLRYEHQSSVGKHLFVVCVVLLKASIRNSIDEHKAHK